MRTKLAIGLLLVACGASPRHWLREAHRLSNAPLRCADAETATRHVTGFTYDSIGCDHAIRQVCRDQVCTQSGETAFPTDPAYDRFRQRVMHMRVALNDQSTAIVDACGDGEAVKALLEISPQGQVEDVFVRDGFRRCLMRNIGTLPSGTSRVLLTFVFRPNSQQP